jgi:hypothetical protein
MVDKLKSKDIRIPISNDKTFRQVNKINNLLNSIVTVGPKSTSHFQKVEFSRTKELKSTSQYNNDTYLKKDLVLKKVKSDFDDLVVLLSQKYDTYPFNPDILKFDTIVYIFNKKLNCIVGYQDDSYTIKNKLLDICVWGNTRDEAETAFVFSFNALYENFALKNDSKLSPEAKKLKTKLLKLVKNRIA